jgi:hypothetical protein
MRIVLFLCADLFLCVDCASSSQLSSLEDSFFLFGLQLGLGSSTAQGFLGLRGSFIIARLVFGLCHVRSALRTPFRHFLLRSALISLAAAQDSIFTARSKVPVY